jgi:F0F1-type ATP synthase assembly protein I
VYRGPLSDQSVVWRQMARISGISFQAIGAVGLGVLLGIVVDRVIPSLGYAGAIVGGVLGSVLSIYLMVRGMRLFFAESDAENARLSGGGQ